MKICSLILFCQYEFFNWIIKPILLITSHNRCWYYVGDSLEKTNVVWTIRMMAVGLWLTNKIQKIRRQRGLFYLVWEIEMYGTNCIHICIPLFIFQLWLNITIVLCPLSNAYIQGVSCPFYIIWGSIFPWKNIVFEELIWVREVCLAFSYTTMSWK